MDRFDMSNLAEEWQEADELRSEEESPSKEFLAAIEHARRAIEESFNRSLRDEDGVLHVRLRKAQAA